jgi:hypothetical protein
LFLIRPVEHRISAWDRLSWEGLLHRYSSAFNHVTPLSSSIFPYQLCCRVEDHSDDGVVSRCMTAAKKPSVPWRAGVSDN